jgi:hypothetical protein
LKRDLKTQTITVKRQRSWDAPDDEQRRDAGNFRFNVSHVALAGLSRLPRLRLFRLHNLGRGWQA